MSKSEWLIAVIAFLAIAAMALFYLPQINVWSKQHPGRRYALSVVMIAFGVWAALTKDSASIPPSIGFAVTLAVFFVSMHRRRRKTIVLELIILSVISSMLHQQTVCAQTGETVIERVPGERATVKVSEMSVVKNDADAIEEARAIALAEFAPFDAEILAADILGNNEKEGRVEFVEKFGGPIVVIIILVVAGIIIVKIVKLCRKHFGPSPSPTNEVPPVAVGPISNNENFYAAYSTFVTYVEECAEEMPSNSIGTFQLSAEVEYGQNGLAMKMTGSSYFPPSSLVSMDGLRSSLEPWGLTLGTNLLPAGTYGYAKNGHPAGAGDVPVSITGKKITVQNGTEPLLTAVLEFSSDLKVWRPVATITVPHGQKVIMEDSPGTRSAFYRFRNGE